MIYLAHVAAGGVVGALLAEWALGGPRWYLVLAFVITVAVLVGHIVRLERRLERDRDDLRVDLDSLADRVANVEGRR